MTEKYILYGVGFLIFVIFLKVITKKYMRHKMDKKVVIWALIPLIWVTPLFYMGKLGPIPSSESTDNFAKVAWVITIVLISNALIQLMIWFIYDYIVARKWGKLPRFIFSLGGLVLLIIAFLISIKIIFNATLTGILVGSTVVTAIIGLALQDTLGNLIAGLSLNVESPFSLGEWVNLGGHEGKIIDQNWRTLTIRTRESHRVSLTNKFISEDKIINYSRPTQRQIHNFYIYLDYSHPPNVVKKILNDLLREIPQVDIRGNLGTFVVDYGDSGIKYCLRYWLFDYAEILMIQDIVLTRIWYTLKRNGIMIPYPISDIKMTVQDAMSAEKNRHKKNKLIEENLRSFGLLSALTDSHLKELVENATLSMYGDGARLVTQGDEGDSMFIITHGKVNVMVKGSNDKEILVKERQEGEFFGEMSLLTGEARSASVIAVGDVEVLILNKKAFTDVLMKNPEILEVLLDILEEQKSGLEYIIALDKEKNLNRPKKAREILMNKIKSYFGIK